ncbi:Disease resistance protein rga2 [Thalictrum thalictroides]|uniref:Disease resistance protein rga2 n=1 Tax=Thalictrum thalictroides TaxID=46969 RepID=A0A7J6V5S1_THATH|nr:Disease resistance protein rga2 [Thalictrum thalictroides]
MRSLRHLDLSECYSLSKMPIKMGQMIELRTLSKFIVGEKTGEHIDELNGLKHLSGELKLTRLEFVKDSTEAKEADLASKPNLSSLLLSWGKFSVPCIHRDGMQQEEMKMKSERVLDCLRPHVNLNQKLAILACQGVVLPSWMSLLRNLREIQLFECWNCETLPPLGQLPRLQVLSISGAHSLKCIGEFYGEVVGHLKRFPALEDLRLHRMPNLEKWEFPSSMHHFLAFESILSGEIENLTALKSLEIVDCYELKSIPDEIRKSHRTRIVGDFQLIMNSSCRSLLVLRIELCDSLTSVSEGL